MAALEARMTARGAQIPNARSQMPKELAIEVIEDDLAVARDAQRPEARGQRPGELSAEPIEEGNVGKDDSAPWPGMTDEASFLAEQRGSGIVPPTGPVSEPTDLSPLPSLEELVQRIPAEARAALDDLFRAKFSGVRRVSKKSLKT
jgi:hypothetical protein